MVSSKVLFFTGIILVFSCLTAVESSYSYCEICPFCPGCQSCSISPCDDMDVPTAIKHLWKFPQDMTPNAIKYKDEIIRLARAARSLPKDEQNKQYGLLLSLSLWAVDRYTGMRSPVAPSCVYQKLVESSLCKCPQAQKKAFQEYHHLCTNATEYSVRIGLIVAGCPVEEIEEGPPLEECKFDKSFKSLLDLKDCALPPSLKRILIDMCDDDSEDDTAIAYAAAGTVTKLSLEMFTELIQTGELLEVVRLKACPAKIPKRCCPKRAKSLTDKTKKLSNRVVKILEKKMAPPKKTKKE